MKIRFMLLMLLLVVAGLLMVACGGAAESSGESGRNFRTGANRTGTRGIGGLFGSE